MTKFILPDWIDKELWNDWEKMRVQILDKKLTDRAKAIAVTKLDQLRRQGYSVTAVLEQSIFNCWQGLWPLKDTKEDLVRTEARVGSVDFGSVHVRSEATERMHAENSRRLALDLKRVADRKRF